MSPVTRGLDEVVEMLINSAWAGGCIISLPVSDHSQRMWFSKHLWSWFRASALREPWLIDEPGGECFKVVEITQQIYTNRSGLGVGCTDINWTYSWIQIVSVIIASTCNIYLEALFLLGLMINLGGKLTMCSWSYKAAGLDDYKSKLQVLEEFTRSERKF